MISNKQSIKILRLEQGLTVKLEQGTRDMEKSAINSSLKTMTLCLSKKRSKGKVSTNLIVKFTLVIGDLKRKTKGSTVIAI